MTRPERISKGLYWDRAWSLVEGCTAVSPGCDHCWSQSATYMRRNNLERYMGLTNEYGRWNGTIHTQRLDLEKPFKVKKPTVWAIWNDFFHPSVDYQFQSWAMFNMHECPQHTFLILTKRPRIARLFFTETEWGVKYSNLPNVWLGVTVESPEYLWRLDELFKCPAAKRFISYEPALAYVDFEEYLFDDDKWACPKCGAVDNHETFYPEDDNSFNKCLSCDYTNDNYEPWVTVRRKLDWLVTGAETGPKPRPADLDWFRDVRDKCIEATVSFFLKQVDRRRNRLLDGRTWDEMPKVGE